jgi:hypothetical protein
VLHLERPLGLTRLVEPGLLAPSQDPYESEGDEEAAAHERYY